MSKHICFLTPSLLLGGAERSLVKIANSYSSLGHQVTIISFTNKSGLQNLLNRDITLHSLSNLSSSNPFLWIKLLFLLNKIEPDIIFGWSLYGNLLAALLHIFKKSTRLILSERNYLPMMMNREKRHTSCRTSVTLFAIRHLYHRAHVITANSQQNIRFLKKYIGLKTVYLHLPNMINMCEINELMQKTSLVPSTCDGPKILAVGRLHHQKGFDVLLKAMQEVHLKHPNWSLVFVGDGPEKNKLTYLTEKYHLKNNIFWAGAQINPFPYYKWADLVVVPSRFEGFPNVPLEAMACGKAVICSDCKTGPRELTCNGEFGILVPVGDAQTLAHEIVSLGEDASLQKKLGNKALEHIEKTYTDKIVQGQIIKLLT